MKLTKMSKTVALGSLAAVTMIAIAGCGTGSSQSGNQSTGNQSSGSPSGNQSSGQATSKGAKQITFLNQETSKTGDSVVIQQLSQEYEKSNPGKVNYQNSFIQQTNLDQKIQLLANSGQLPNMYELNTPSLQAQLVKSGKALNLEPVLKNLGVWNDLLPAAIQAERQEIGISTGLYDLPMQLNIEGFWYNKQLFQKYNLQAPTTWTQMLDDAKVFKSHGIQPFAADGKDGWPLTRLIGGYAIRYYGADAMKQVKDGTLKLTDPGFVKAAQVVQTMGKDGYFGPGVSTVDYTTALNEFLQGKAAMYYMGSWVLGDFNNTQEDKIGAANIGFFNIPTVKGGKGNLDTWEMNTGIGNQFSKAGYDATEGDWLKYVVGKFGDTSLSKYGNITGWKISNMPSNLPPLTQSTITTLNNVKQSALWFEAYFSPQATKLSQQQVQLLVTGSLSPQQFLSQLQSANQ